MLPNKLGEEFLSTLYADFQGRGQEVIARVREEKPDAYLKVIASLLPRQLDVPEPRPLEELSDEQLNRLIHELMEAEDSSLCSGDDSKRH